MATVTARVKGGMPITVEASYIGAQHSVGFEGGWDIDSVNWSNTGKPVTKKFFDSLSPSDWDNIYDALREG